MNEIDPILNMASSRYSLSRRRFVQYSGAAGIAAGLGSLLPAYAWSDPVRRGPAALEPRMVDGLAVYDLEIAETAFEVAGRRTTATTINGTVPGPLLHLYEGQEALLRVTNRLHEDTSLHWHGLILPPEMDGVPGVSFPGIPPGTTFEYRFPLLQSGTYWYHSHSGLQEQLGHYGPMIIHPAAGYPYQVDREYTIVLSDWTFEDPHDVLAKLKKQSNYYNQNRRTLVGFFQEAARVGFGQALRNRLTWAEMRMDPTDLSDISGATYTYLMNGLAPQDNWTGLFEPGERVLLHVINAAAGSYFDLRIPGLPMTVVQASGQYVEPVETDEIRIAVAETYDVIVEPGDGACTLFAESMDRTGYARGTLAPRIGLTAPVPEMRERRLLTMEDMGMDHGAIGGAGAATMDQTGDGVAVAPDPHAGHSAEGPMESMEVGMRDLAVAGAVRTQGLRPPGTLPGMADHEQDTHGPGNAAVPMMVGSRMSSPGVGLGDDGWRVLTYTQLRALHPRSDFRPPDREVELHLTGNMERFIWAINGVRFEDSEAIRFNYGERLRLTLVNDTMMNHPMHLHGMWMELENGQEELIPRVHTVNVQPAEQVSLLITVDAPGSWAFHCHLLYHMEVGMFRVVTVNDPGDPAGDRLLDPATVEEHLHGD